MQVIKDKRERCDECSKTALDDVEEVHKMLKNEVPEFFSMINHEMPQDDIKVQFCYTDEIQKVLGRPWNPTRLFDVRSTGVASLHENTIRMENGMPLKMSVMVTIHEWVHLWQYKHLDYHRMKKDRDLEYIEGQTTWSEIYYAEKKWKEGVLWERQNGFLTRNDEYGRGYRLMKKIESETGLNPFEWLLMNYPKSK